MPNVPISGKVYDVGDGVRTTATFTVNGALTDPSTVTFKYKSPANVVVTLAYGTDVAVVRDAVGTFHCTFTASASGSWFYRWVGTGDAAGAAERMVQVRESEF